ncbi:MAG: protein YgfX [Methylophaga sp.]
MSDKTFKFQFTASRRLAYLILLMHMLALAAVWLANLNILAQLSLSVLLLLSVGVYEWDFVQKRLISRQLQYLPDTGWQLAEGNNLLPIALKQCFISRPLIIVNFRQTGKSRSLLLLTDSADPDALRKCRILLRQTV